MEVQNAVASDAVNSERSSGYYNLLSYIVSNAISGEIMAVENYSEMVLLMQDSPSRVATNHQAWEECKHILQLGSLARKLGFNVEKRIVEPQWKEIRRHFSAAVTKKNLAASLIIQDLMTETMAILLYRILGNEKKTDVDTAKIAANILRDELDHLEIGIARIRALLAENSSDVHDALVWAHHRVMPELISMISTSCHFLCDVLKLDCASLSLAEIKTDIDSIRADALEQYVDTLERVGFDPKVVNPLIASMSAFEGMKNMKIGAHAGIFTQPDGTRCC
jgi:fatty aldehyde decarbonylase